MQCERPESGDRGRSLCIVVSTGTTPCTAALSGELDSAGAGRLQATLLTLLREGHRKVVCDMSGLDFLDAAGLGVLVRAHAEFRASGGGLAFRGVQPRHRRLLVLTALDRVLDVE